MSEATLIAGTPSLHKAIYHRIRFMAHDPAVWVRLEDGRTIVLVRDVELGRAKEQINADEVVAYAAYAPDGGLPADRELAAPIAAVECLKRHGASTCVTDRSLPFVYADEAAKAGIELVCDRQLGIMERRRKDEQEVSHMRAAQEITESALEIACQMIARARANGDGVLMDPEYDGRSLTSERVKSKIDMYLAERGFSSDGHIVACGPLGADCHESGSGPIRTGQPVIIDVFPKDNATGYHGDCTRCVVHGEIPDEVARMHETVLEAKRASIEALRPGATGEDVHNAAIEVIRGRGYEVGFPPEGAPDGFCSMPHGTGHGLGLDLKEPPLLDTGGPELVAGDAVTVEPGLYKLGVGGIRIEDLLIVTEDGSTNLNRLGEGLDWT